MIPFIMAPHTVDVELITKILSYNLEIATAVTYAPMIQLPSTKSFTALAT
jgi:hypothetical protein